MDAASKVPQIKSSTVTNKGQSFIICKSPPKPSKNLARMKKPLTKNIISG